MTMPSDGFVGSFVEPRLGTTVGVRRAGRMGVGWVVQQAELRRLTWGGGIQKSRLCNERPLLEEDGAKMCAPFSFAVVASIRTMVISSGA
jgi:hypothetical protein